MNDDFTFGSVIPETRAVSAQVNGEPIWGLSVSTASYWYRSKRLHIGGRIAFTHPLGQRITDELAITPSPTAMMDMLDIELLTHLPANKVIEALNNVLEHGRLEGIRQSQAEIHKALGIALRSY